MTLLPKVTKETDNAVLHDIQYPGYVHGLFKQIKQDNPVIAGMIAGMCSRYLENLEQTDEKPMMPVEVAMTMATLVYRQLESQAETDLLKKQLLV